MEMKHFYLLQKPYDTTSMWSLNYDTSELIYKTKTDSQPWRTDW